MKKFLFTIAAGALLFAGCTKDLEKRVDTLEKQMTEVQTAIEKLNSELADVKTLVDALDKKLAVSKLENTADGYILTFTDGSVLTLENGKTPVVGVMDVDGVLCWAVNGEPLLYNGSPVPATGAKGDKGDQGEAGAPGHDGAPGQDGNDGKDAPVPSFSIDENGHLWVTIDGTKTDLGLVAGADGKDGVNGADGKDGVDGTNGKDGDSWFSGVDLSEDGLYYTITLAAGGTIVFPAYVELDIVFESFNYTAYDAVEVPFTIKGNNVDDVVVRAYPSAGWSVAVNESSLTVTAGDSDGYVDVYLIDNATGAIRAKSLTFKKDAAVSVEEKSYAASAAGGEVVIPVSKYVDYTVEVTGADWLTHVQTKAEAVKENLLLKASDNADGSTRTATVNLKAGTAIAATFEVTQKGYISALIDKEFKESFGYSDSNTSTTPKLSDKGRFTITLSDDPSKGTYYIDGIYNLPNYIGTEYHSGRYYADSEGSTLTVLAANGVHDFFTSTDYNNNDLALTVSDDCKTISGPAVTPDKYFSAGYYFYNYTATLVEEVVGGDSIIDKIVGNYAQTWDSRKSVVSASSSQDIPVDITKVSDTEVKIDGVFGYASNTITCTVNESSKTLTVASPKINLYGPCNSLEFTIDDSDVLTIKLTSPASGNNVAQWSTAYFYDYVLTKN